MVELSSVSISRQHIFSAHDMAAERYIRMHVCCRQSAKAWLSVTVIVSRVCGAGDLPDGVLEGESKREAGHLLPFPLSPVEVHHSTSNGDVPTGAANQT